MTHQAPSGRPRPPRAAQHAAPHYPSTPLRQHAGRALRLFAAAGTGAMGLCVVIGAIALVAATTTTSPQRATHLASDLQRGPGRHRAAGGSGAPPGVGPRPAGARQGRPARARQGRPAGVRQGRPAGASRPRPAGASQAWPAAARRDRNVFRGRGSRRTRPFGIGGNGTWTLVWSYSCRAPWHRGSFAVSEDGARTSAGVSVHETGVAGHGATWAFSDAGTHTLVVSSGCAWTLRVLRQPPPS